MIRALIIDDEASTIQVLRILIQRHIPEISEVYTALGGVEGLEKAQSVQPDLIFLDIEMPEIDGFELLRQMPQATFEVIFVTAYSQHAIQAIRFSAFDYLLKPVDIQDLRNAVQRYLLQKKQDGNFGQRYQSLVQNLRQNDYNHFTLSIHTLEGIHLLPLSDIIRCEADGNYTCFYLQNKKRVLASRTLGDFEALLDPGQFKRVHKSFLVHRMHVRSFSGQGYLEMSDTSTVEVSRRKIVEVKAWLDKG